MKSALQQPKRYGGLLITIHWLMALGILVAFAAGLYMVSIPGITPDKLRLYNWHKWLGVSLLALVLLRVVVKASGRTPRYPQHWGRNTILMAQLGHWALYIFMFVVPTLGYLFSLASGYPVVWFGVIKLPVLIEKNAELKELFQTLHGVSAKILIALVVGHVLMALKHHFKDKDSILGRMLPGASQHH